MKKSNPDDDLVIENNDSEEDLYTNPSPKPSIISIDDYPTLIVAFRKFVNSQNNDDKIINASAFFKILDEISLDQQVQKELIRKLDNATIIFHNKKRKPTQGNLSASLIAPLFEDGVDASLKEKAKLFIVDNNMLSNLVWEVKSTYIFDWINELSPHDLMFYISNGIHLTNVLNAYREHNTNNYYKYYLYIQNLYLTLYFEIAKEGEEKFFKKYFSLFTPESLYKDFPELLLIIANSKDNEGNIILHNQINILVGYTHDYGQIIKIFKVLNNIYSEYTANKEIKNNLFNLAEILLNNEKAITKLAESYNNEGFKELLNFNLTRDYLKNKERKNSLVNTINRCQSITEEIKTNLIALVNNALDNEICIEVNTNKEGQDSGFGVVAQAIIKPNNQTSAIQTIANTPEKQELIIDIPNPNNAIEIVRVNLEGVEEDQVDNIQIVEQSPNGSEEEGEITNTADYNSYSSQPEKTIDIIELDENHLNSQSPPTSLTKFYQNYKHIILPVAIGLSALAIFSAAVIFAPPLAPVAALALKAIATMTLPGFICSVVSGSTLTLAALGWAGKKISNIFKSNENHIKKQNVTQSKTLQSASVPADSAQAEKCVEPVGKRVVAKEKNYREEVHEINVVAAQSKFKNVTTLEETSTKKDENTAEIIDDTFHADVTRNYKVKGRIYTPRTTLDEIENDLTNRVKLEREKIYMLKTQITQQIDIGGVCSIPKYYLLETFGISIGNCDFPSDQQADKPPEIKVKDNKITFTTTEHCSSFVQYSTNAISPIQGEVLQPRFCKPLFKIKLKKDLENPIMEIKKTTLEKNILERYLSNHKADRVTNPSTLNC